MDLTYENSLVAANNAPVKVVAFQEKGNKNGNQKSSRSS